MSSERTTELYVTSLLKFGTKDPIARTELLNDESLGITEQFDTRGLMLVFLTPEDVDNGIAQLDNLDPLLNLGEEERPAAFIMHPWKPLTGTVETPLNFLTHPNESREMVEKSINIAAAIPTEMVPPSGRAVTFHLSAYLPPDKMTNYPEYYERIIEEEVKRHLKEVVDYGKRNNSVRVHIETLPVTPFSDWLPSEGSELSVAGQKLYPRDLVTPYPLLPWRKEVNQIREAGVGLTIDWGHTHVALESIRQAAGFMKQNRELGKKALNFYGLFEPDLEHSNAVDDFANQISSMTQDGDIVHATNEGGEFKVKELHGIDQDYDDEVALTNPEANISEKERVQLIKDAVQKENIKLVIEDGEPEDVLFAPNARASAEFIAEVASQL